MQPNKIELTPEQKGVLAALSEETGEPVSALIDQVLDALQERMRTARASGRQDSCATDDAAKPIWEKIIEAGHRIPEEELKDLPTDLAANVDHYADSLPSGPYYPAKSAEDRLAALRALRGMWKGRDPDPVEYFEKLRQEPDRELPARQR